MIREGKVCTRRNPRKLDASSLSLRGMCINTTSLTSKWISRRTADSFSPSAVKSQQQRSKGAPSILANHPGFFNVIEQQRYHTRLFLRRPSSETGYRCCDDPSDALWARATSTASPPPVIPCHSCPPSTEASILSASGTAFWSVPEAGSPAPHCTLTDVSSVAGTLSATCPIGECNQHSLQKYRESGMVSRRRFPPRDTEDVSANKEFRVSRSHQSQNVIRKLCLNIPPYPCIISQSRLPSFGPSIRH